MAIHTKYCYFEYQLMLFGFFYATASYPRCIKKIWGEKLDMFVIVSLDDILIYIDEANYVNTIGQVLNQLKKYSLYDNLKKYCFHKEKMQFPGCV